MDSRPPNPPVPAAGPAVRVGPLSMQAWPRTFASLVNPNFRTLWISLLFSFTAIQMSFVSQGLLTFRLTGSATALAVVSLGWGIAQLPLAFISGVAADRLHKRWLIMVSQATMALSSLITGLLIVTNTIEVWHIFAMSLVGGSVFAFNIPARQAWIPELVPDDHLMNAVALNSAAFTSTGILGPGLAGILIAAPFVDLAQIYFLMSGLFVIVVLMLMRIPGGEPPEHAGRPHPLRESLDGLRYIKRHPVLPTLMLLGWVPIVIGSSYRTFFPVFQERVYGVSESWLGAMGAISAIGALVGALWVASLTATSQRALIQLAGGIGFGVALILFGAAPALLPGLVALLFVGLTSNGYWALNNTMVLGATDREYYGRVMSLYILSWSIAPFAALPASVVADTVGVRQMEAGVGMLLIVLMVAIAVLLPGHRRQREEEARVAAG